MYCYIICALYYIILSIILLHIEYGKLLHIFYTNISFLQLHIWFYAIKLWIILMHIFIYYRNLKIAYLIYM